SYMANEEENHALIADDEVSTEFALMAKSSSSSDKEVYDDSYCFKSCRKNTENLNTKTSELNKKLSDCEIDLYNYKIGLSQVEARLVKFKEHEVKYCERIRVLERDVEFKDNKIEYLKYELEQVKKEKESLPEFVDDTVTDYNRPTPSIDTSKCNKSKQQSSNFSAFEHGESSDSIMSKPMIKFVKEADCPRVTKTNNTENARKSIVKYAEMYRNISKAHSNVKRPFQRKSVVKSQPRVPRVSTVTGKIPTVDSKFPTAKSTLTADLGNKRKAVKALACWTWRSKQNTSKQGLNYNGVSMTFKKYQYIDTQGRLKILDSGCSRHMTGNISYLSEHEPYDGGYVSFGHGVGKITGKGIIKTGKLEFENVYFVKEIKNRTLIEAGRTMLADAKLPVTFWAEVVNTACYVQNRVLVNKSQNKTLYELFNSSIPAIGFLRPFRCHVMILNTLDHLGKFDAKGDEGTSSTIISSIKDVASQAVKKDVTSLRYIALPNCGISNPTATSKVPSAEQVKPDVSLTVESKSLTEEPKKIFDALKNPSWVEAMQEELIQFKIQNVWVLVDYFPDRVYKVEKAMYGVHQAPRAWYGTLFKYLLDNGFQRGTIDHTLFIRKHKGEFMLVQVYLKGHPKLGLWYHKESPFDLVAYSDSDYGGATQDRNSTTRGCQFLGRRLISWQCKKQTIVATSKTKAEYVAAASDCGQVL
nr:ribonuclease H-like domain, reverse transcriptase, RNA-dependent DNA polymerase [Tanacetum cinerariifolium]